MAAGIRDLVNQVMKHMGVKDEDVAKQATKAAQPQVAAVLTQLNDPNQQSVTPIHGPAPTQPDPNAPASMPSMPPMSEQDMSQQALQQLQAPVVPENPNQKFKNPFQYRTPFLG